MYLNTVKARQVSVRAYQLLSIKCSVSAARSVPKNTFLCSGVRIVIMSSGFLPVKHQISNFKDEILE